ncbi:unnamed protein product [Prunus brigantina]
MHEVPHPCQKKKGIEVWDGRKQEEIEFTCLLFFDTTLLYDTFAWVLQSGTNTILF